MWLLRAATFAGYVGLTSLPVSAITACTQKNIICGVATYEKYLRTADIQTHLSCVIEYLYDELGEAFLDICAFLAKTGSVLVVVDLARYIGIALAFVAIDETLRIFGVLGERRRYDTNVRQLGEIHTTDLLHQFGQHTESCEATAEKIPNLAPTSWTYVRTWDDLVQQRSEDDQFRILESERKERFPLSGTESFAHSEPETQENRVYSTAKKCDRENPIKANNTKNLLLVVDTSHYDSSGSVASTYKANGLNLPSLTDIPPSRQNVVELQNRQDMIVNSFKENIVSRDANQPPTSGVHCPYDADISDQETSAISKRGRAFCRSGSETYIHSSQQRRDPAPRSSISSSHYENTNKKLKTRRQPRLETRQGAQEGVYSRMKRLHISRIFGPNGHYVDPKGTHLTHDQVETKTSSKEYYGLECNRTITKPAVSVRRESQETNEALMLEGSENTFDSPSYTLSSHALFPEEIPTDRYCLMPKSVSDSLQDTIIVSSQKTDNILNNEGVQQITFWQLPRFTSVSSHQEGPSVSNCSRSVRTRCRSHNLQPVGRQISMMMQRSNRRMNQSIDDIHIAERSSESGGSNMAQLTFQKQSHGCWTGNPELGAYRDLFSAGGESAVVRLSRSRDLTWRVLFIHVICWVLFGRDWRKFF